MPARGRKSYNQYRYFWGFLLYIVVVLIFILCIMIIVFLTVRENSPLVNTVRLPDNYLDIVDSSIVSSVMLNPTVEIVNGTELIWQIPDSPRAILFLAHGCGGRAANFWDKSNSCPHCDGLPEERLILTNALIHKFAVLAISSVRKCWSLGKEKVVVRDAIQWWAEKNQLSSIPLVAIGASSGGYFVSLLANDNKLRFSSIVIMIAEGLFDQMDVKADYPPTLFVHMPKDQRRNRIIPTNVEMLRKQGVDAQELKCMEFPLTPSFLGDRIPGLSLTVSQRLYELFRVKGFIDTNGYMNEDGRKTPWVNSLKESKIPFPYDTISTHHIQEELNLAYAYHEMTSLPSKAMFEWFGSHMTRDNS